MAGSGIFYFLHYGSLVLYGRVWLNHGKQAFEINCGWMIVTIRSAGIVRDLPPHNGSPVPDKKTQRKNPIEYLDILIHGVIVLRCFLQQ